MAMSLNHPLTILVHVIDSGSFSAAARVLYMSQPAVSSQIRALESSLGVQLLERRPGGARPTSTAARPWWPRRGPSSPCSTKWARSATRAPASTGRTGSSSPPAPPSVPVWVPPPHPLGLPPGARCLLPRSGSATRRPSRAGWWMARQASVSPWASRWTSTSSPSRCWRRRWSWASPLSGATSVSTVGLDVEAGRRPVGQPVPAAGQGGAVGDCRCTAARQASRRSALTTGPNGVRGRGRADPQRRGLTQQPLHQRLPGPRRRPSPSLVALQRWPACPNAPCTIASAAASQVGVGQHDHRVLPAELELGAGQPRAPPAAGWPARPAASR